MFLLDKLKKRPNPSTQKSFDIRLNMDLQKEDNEEIKEEDDEKRVTNIPKKNPVKYIDYREHSTINRADILKRIKDSDLSSVKRTMPTSKMSVNNVPEKSLLSEETEAEEEINSSVEEPAPVPETKNDETLPVDEPIVFKRKVKKGVKSAPVISPVEEPVKEISSEDLGEIVIKKPRAKKQHIATISKIGSETVLSRLPKAAEKIIYRSPQYYMNNRKLFTQKINKLFEPYLQQINETQDSISCEKRAQSEDFQLLIHQQIVRDYLNIYTPYRGLLLLHGLGSGKSCSSIAIAEGMKSEKPIVLMTPASLKMNFFTELKKCGDLIYKKNQYWEFVSTDGKPEYITVLSSALSLPMETIQKNKGAWLVDVNKPANFTTLSDSDQFSIDEQINMMIRSKYKDVNYNGLNTNKMAKWTENDTKNPFDNAVVIIDEAHNFVSRIVNKIKSPNSIAYKLYNYLMKASNARIVLLTGTPIINYPNEIGILYNILRGYIKTWTFPLNVKTTTKINRDSILEMFEAANLRTYDYVEYSGNTLTVTRNPYGFINMRKPGPSKKKAGGGNKKQKTRKLKKDDSEEALITSGTVVAALEMQDHMDMYEEEKANEPFFDDQYNSTEYSPIYGGEGDFEKYNGVQLSDSGNISDEKFVSIIENILKNNGLAVYTDNIEVKYHKTLPDNSDEFLQMFTEDSGDGKDMKNKSLFQRRILGLTSYFKSAQEQLLPRMVLDEDGEKYYIESVDMSDHQFTEYEKIRKEESERDTALKRMRKKMSKEELFTISTTYRIYSRSACNFAFPGDIKRPFPDNEKEAANIDGMENNEENEDVDVPVEESAKPDTIEYKERIKAALEQLKSNSSEYFSPINLQMYSPKFLRMLENILDEENKGLHLVYSQFRTMEGIGIFKMVLEYNGFSEFKIKKNSETDQWEILEEDSDVKKPKFALYTGTETAEEKEIIRNIYNGDWKFVPESITQKLRERSENNMYGEAIRVLMISASGAEGINLKNTRFVHIMEPYWNMVRIQQVVGRARRICSHEQLPEELRTVKVFIYLSSLSDSQRKSEASKELILRDVSRLDDNTPVTTDESLYEIAKIKDDIINKILNAMKEAAIDCSLYSKKSDENLVCYGFGNVKTNAFSSYPTIDEDMGQKEDVVQEKLKLSTVTIKTVKYAFNKTTFELYNMDDYENTKKTNRPIYPIGRLTKTQTGYVIESVV